MAKKIAEILDVSPGLKPSTGEIGKRQGSEINCKRPLLVWTRLAEMFGKSLYREHGERPTEIWIAAVGKLNDDEIRRGLARLGSSALSFPPNVGQFVDACKKVDEQRPWLWLNKGDSSLIEDKRVCGTMSYADWKRGQKGG